MESSRSNDLRELSLLVAYQYVVDLPGCYLQQQHQAYPKEADHLRISYDECRILMALIDISCVQRCRRDA